VIPEVKPRPVTSGLFPDGTDLLIWNPQLPSRRWRREAVRASIDGKSMRWGAYGVAAVGLGLGPASGIAAALLILFGLAWLGLAAARLVIFSSNWEIEHDHPKGKRCRLERRPGEFFYRKRDFADLGPRVASAVAYLIDAVSYLHRTPARSWLDPELPDRVHRVVWEALSCVDRTRAARVLAQKLTAESDEEELAAAARLAIGTLDEALDELVAHLRACVTLTVAWEQKLRHADLADRVETTVQALQEIPLRSAADDAAELPPAVFAWLTAARDLTDAGPFAWELLSPNTPTPQRRDADSATAAEPRR
jgi:hypothetical protein